jgi:ribonuclease R
VAIADVSHYVETGSAIDVDAYDRATSVYFPRRVIPMLPEKLSNGLCSLNPEVERLCMVCDMLVNAAGEVQAYQFYPAVMFSHARFTYTEVAAILANTRGPEAMRRQERVQRPAEPARRLPRVARSAHRRAARWISKPPRPRSSATRRAHRKIIPRVRNEAHKLIEEACWRPTSAVPTSCRTANTRACSACTKGPRPRRRRSCATTSRRSAWA